MLADPEQPTSVLAERIAITPATLWRRIERMREAGIIKGQRVRIDWRALGYEVEVSLRFTLDKANPRAFDEFAQAAREIAEVTEIQNFLGSVDYRLSVIARDLTHWQQIYREQILALPHVDTSEALMLISTIKNSDALPI